MDQKRLHVGLITSFITMLIYLDQGHLTWTVVGVTVFLTLFAAIKKYTSLCKLIFYLFNKNMFTAESYCCKHVFICGKNF
ncbi:hypothetical protein [Enterococcus faecium]|nr:hypothetical protein [Enterococcus faecium]MDN3050131.1 hypothetical protein [Enterococcus faecium]